MIHLHRLHFPSEKNTVTRHRGAAVAAALVDNVDLASLASEPSRTRFNSLQNLVLTSQSGREAALAGIRQLKKDLGLPSDFPTLRLKHYFAGETLPHLDMVMCAVCALDSNRIACTGYDRLVRVWDLNSGEYTLVLEGHTDWVTSVCAIDGNRIASGGLDMTVRVWNLNSGENTHTLTEHTGWAYSVCKIDTNRIASAGRDRTVCVYDLNSGANTHMFTGHNDLVHSVCKIDGNRIASSSYDRTVRVWYIGPE